MFESESDCEAFCKGRDDGVSAGRAEHNVKRWAGEANRRHIRNSSTNHAAGDGGGAHAAQNWVRLATGGSDAEVRVWALDLDSQAISATALRHFSTLSWVLSVTFGGYHPLDLP